MERDELCREASSRNENFWDEAEFYITDVLATVVLNATVLTMLSPVATLGKSPGGGMSLLLKSRMDGKLNGRNVFPPTPCI